jgi:glycosyltransferase involved in cell wall biosynthesis
VTAQTVLPAEVIVVDAGSVDQTARIAESYAGALLITVLRRDRLHPGEARNEGARQATCGWLAFTDGGIRLDPRWLEMLLAAADGQQAVFGTYEPVCATKFDRWAAVAYVPAVTPMGIRGPSVVSMLVTQEAFFRAGAFPPYRAAEDLLFLDRLFASTASINFAPAAVARWELARGWRATLRRFALYSRHNLRSGAGRLGHGALGRQYAMVALIVAALHAAGAGVWSLAIIPAWVLGRAGRAAWSKRRSFAFPTLRPDTVVGAAAVLLAMDFAIWAGAAAWLIVDRRRSEP